MGIAALICAFMCAFFLKEPKGSFAAAYEGEAPETATQNPILLTEE
jgi:MFS transporter, NNP family, nitrate/nitrite transporter